MTSVDSVFRDAVINRSLGALLGQATGDALGTTVEFDSRARIQARFPDGLREIVGGGPFRVQPGQVTDDTELALALARSLAEVGTWDADRVAWRYLGWFRSRPFDIGSTTAQAFGDPRGEVAGSAAALERRANRASQANGSLMRASPLGVFGWQLPEEQLARIAADDSRLSHPHPLCQAACAVFTRAIADAVGSGGSPGEIYDRTVAFARRTPAAAPALPLLEAAATRPPERFQPQEGWVAIALQNAFHRLLAARDPAEAIIATVMEGGDTDTNGCIAGALVGAVHGAAAIPATWRQAVLTCRTSRPADYWCHDLPQLAEALAFPQGR